MKRFKRKATTLLKRVKKGENIRGVTSKFISLDGVSNKVLVEMCEAPTKLDGVNYELMMLRNGDKYLIDMSDLEESIKANHDLTIDPNSPEGYTAMAEYIREHKDFTTITLEELKSKFGKVTKRVIIATSKSMDDYVINYVNGGILVKLPSPKQTYLYKQ